MSERGSQITRMIFACATALLAVYCILNFVLWPKDQAYWSRHLWVAPVAVACISSFVAIMHYPKKRTYGGAELVGLAFVCGLAIFPVATGLQYFQ